MHLKGIPILQCCLLQIDLSVLSPWTICIDSSQDAVKEGIGTRHSTGSIVKLIIVCTVPYRGTAVLVRCFYYAGYR